MCSGAEEARPDSLGFFNILKTFLLHFNLIIPATRRELEVT